METKPIMMFLKHVYSIKVLVPTRNYSYKKYKEELVQNAQLIDTV